MRMFSAALFFVLLTGWQVTGYAAQGGAAMNGGGGVGVGVGGPAGAGQPGAGVGNGGGGGGGAQPAKKPEFKKWDLPAPAKMKKFDPTLLTKHLGKVALSPETLADIATLKEKVQKEADARVDAQERAREAYALADNEQDATACAKQVIFAKSAVEEYDPNERFWGGLHKLMPDEKLQILKKEMSAKE